MEEDVPVVLGMIVLPSSRALFMEGHWVGRQLFS